MDGKATAASGVARGELCDGCGTGLDCDQASEHTQDNRMTVAATVRSAMNAPQQTNRAQDDRAKTTGPRQQGPAEIRATPTAAICTFRHQYDDVNKSAYAPWQGARGPMSAGRLRRRLSREARLGAGFSARRVSRRD
jgi:hypothetical protein